jgi:Uma2 family endonuclease
MAMPLTHRRFTVDEYHRMADAGVLREGDRLELIDGEVVEMTPIGPRHAGCVDRLNHRLTRQAGERAVLRVQGPVVLGLRAEPEPDIAVLKPPFERYARTHPRAGDILLVIEVSETSVEYDRSVKLPLYARMGIPEVWLVNLPADRIETYRDPQEGRYLTPRLVSRGETLSLLELPDVTLPADEILGPRAR